MKKNVFLCGIFAAAFVIVSAFTACMQPYTPSNKPAGNSSGNPPVTINSIADLAAYLSGQPANTAAAPYNVILNVNNLGGASTVTGSVGAVFKANPAKFVNLDLSGSGITSIDIQAFETCTTLTGVTLPSGVTDIKSSAFNRCYNLTGVTIPGSVTILGDWAFGNNDKLTSVTFQGTIPAADFSSMGSFFGDLRTKFYAANSANGTPGTYTTTAPVSATSTWTKRP
jgi:hypothetical protein